MALYLGCPIWSFKGWVGSFYPEGTKAADYLREYSRRLNTVEGNTTFYVVPAPGTLHKWVGEMPETFRFAPNAAHDQPRRQADEHTEEAAQLSRSWLSSGPAGTDVPTTPPSYRRSFSTPKDSPDLAVGGRLAVEVRHDLVRLAHTRR
jgi:uncharacterized protein YecE (DUF72 family)